MLGEISCLRLHSDDPSCVFAFASDGRIYPSNCYWLSGFADPATEQLTEKLLEFDCPFNQSMGLPPLSEAEMAQAGSLPFATDSSAGLAYINGILYGWGLADAFGLGNSSVVLPPMPINLTSILPTTGAPDYYSANITHLAIQSPGSVVVLADGTVFQMFQLEKVVHPDLTSLVRLKSSTHDSSGLVSLKGVYDQFIFLFSDGSVWTHFLAKPEVREGPRLVLNWVNPNSAGPWRSDFGPALPPGFVIRSMVTDTDQFTTTFVATKVEADATIPPLLSRPPSPQSHRLVALKAFNPALSAYRWHSEGSNIETFKTYSEPKLNQFTQIAVGAKQYMILTINGSLLMTAGRISSTSTTGMQTSYTRLRVLPIERPSTGTEPPLLIDQRVFSNKKVTYIASGYEHSAAILEDGTLAAWGLNFDPFASTTPVAPVPPPPDPPFVEPDALPFGSNVVIYNAPNPSEPFKRVFVMNQNFLILDTAGRLHSIGQWEEPSFISNIVTHNELMQNVGAVKMVAFGKHGDAWMIAGTSNATIVHGTVDISPNADFSDSRFSYHTINTSISVSSIRSVSAGDGFMLILNDEGLLGIGNHPVWFTRDDANGIYATPKLVVMPGLPPASSLQRILVDSGVMFALTKDGKLLATCDKHFHTRCSAQTAQIREVAGRFNVSLLWDLGTSKQHSRIIATPRDNYVKPRDMSTPYLNILMGAAISHFSFGSDPLEGSDGSIWLLPESHPFNYDNVSNIKLSVGATFNYTHDSSTTLSSIWSGLFAGDKASETSRLPSLFPFQLSSDVVYGEPHSVGFATVSRDCNFTQWIPSWFVYTTQPPNPSLNSVNGLLDPVQAINASTPAPLLYSLLASRATTCQSPCPKLTFASTLVLK